MTDTVVKNPVIPAEATFYDTRDMRIRPLNECGGEELDLREICVFLATGFFLGDASYYRNIKAIPPATEYTHSEGRISSPKKYWEWSYNPRNITLDQAVEEFGHLFENVVRSNISGKKIILPLSGGLDSRTLAAALKPEDNVISFSYEFLNSFPETKYGAAIADVIGIPFYKYVIPAGYLWDKIYDMARLTWCTSEFTHPRQAAVADEVKNFGDTFLLGHWGDVLFDGMGAAGATAFDQQLEIVKKKIIKRGGAELAQSVWQAWGLQGSFETYFHDRVGSLLNEIKIEDPNARIRAFKSSHWVYRWTSTNLKYFTDERPAVLPYYSEELARFITTVDEKLLADRKIQIEYLKRKHPKIASIPWQTYEPLNLYNYTSFNSPTMLPYRAARKIKNILSSVFSSGKVVTRNWEIQFLGDDNRRNLEAHLFDSKAFSEFVPKSVVQEFYDKFNKEDNVYYSHSVSMLLTLSLFTEINKN